MGTYQQQAQEQSASSKREPLNPSTTQQHIMAFPTQSVFVHRSNDWDETTRTHPALVFFEKYTRSYDANGPSWDGWFTDDFVYQKSDGTEHYGKEGFEEVKRNYGVFVKFNHIPYTFYCSETSFGYDFFTQAWMYVDYPGAPVPGEKGVKNPRDGAQWDGKLAGAYRFEIRKIDDGFRIQRGDVHVDTAPAIMAMMARGIKLG